MDNDKEYAELIKERFVLLPKVVQQAITSADVEKQLRALADTHKLHLDQWQTLQDQVMLTLLGVEHSDDLEKNIKDKVGMSGEAATALAADISKIVFEPVRQELERQLENPDAQKATVTNVEAARTEMLAQEKPVAPVVTTPPVAPATPPTAPNEEKVVRAPISESYKAGETSIERKSVHDDPYREPPA